MKHVSRRSKSMVITRARHNGHLRLLSRIHAAIRSTAAAEDQWRAQPDCPACAGMSSPCTRCASRSVTVAAKARTIQSPDCSGSGQKDEVTGDLSSTMHRHGFDRYCRTFRISNTATLVFHWCDAVSDSETRIFLISLTSVHVNRCFGPKNDAITSHSIGPGVSAAL